MKQVYYLQKYLKAKAEIRYEYIYKKNEKLTTKKKIVREETIDEKTENDCFVVRK